MDRVPGGRHDIDLHPSDGEPLSVMTIVYLPLAHPVLLRGDVEVDSGQIAMSLIFL